MVHARLLLDLVLRGYARLLGSDGDGEDRERGDVPGWVMITIMTAGIVVVLWGVAQPALSDLLGRALDSVRGPQ